MARIAELWQFNTHLSEASIDEVCNEQSIHVTALICGLLEKLAVQEERAQQTALEVQQLSTSFQLLTPILTQRHDLIFGSSITSVCAWTNHVQYLQHSIIDGE